MGASKKILLASLRYPRLGFMGHGLEVYPPPLQKPHHDPKNAQEISTAATTTTKTQAEFFIFTRAPTNASLFKNNRSVYGILESPLITQNINKLLEFSLVIQSFRMIIDSI